MTANAADLRELADALELFPGIKAREWTPGPDWCLTFTALPGEGRQNLLALCALLTVLLVSDVKAQPLAPRPTDEWEYRIGDGDHLALVVNLRLAGKELWRVR